MAKNKNRRNRTTTSSIKSAPPTVNKTEEKEKAADKSSALKWFVQYALVPVVIAVIGAAGLYLSKKPEQDNTPIKPPDNKASNQGTPQPQATPSSTPPSKPHKPPKKEQSEKNLSVDEPKASAKNNVQTTAKRVDGNSNSGQTQSVTGETKASGECSQAFNNVNIGGNYHSECNAQEK